MLAAQVEPEAPKTRLGSGLGCSPPDDEEYELHYCAGEMDRYSDHTNGFVSIAGHGP